MAKLKSTDGFREGDRVAAADDLPGVPAGTLGRVFMANGLTWKRYRVDFDNGVALSLVDGKHLTAARRR